MSDFKTNIVHFPKKLMDEDGSIMTDSRILINIDRLAENLNNQKVRAALKAAYYQYLCDKFEGFPTD